MKIIAPNKNYTGVSAGVAFANGVGECENPDTIAWFKAHGYGVTESLADEKQAALELVKDKLEEVKKINNALLAENEELKKTRDALRAEIEEINKKVKKPAKEIQG